MVYVEKIITYYTTCLDFTMKMTYSSELDPSTKSKINLKLYQNVKNVAELRQKVMNGTLQCGIIKPNLIIDPFQVVVAANKAKVQSKLVTKNIYTELLFDLSISKNITQSLQKFGVGDDDKNVLVAVISQEEQVDEIFNQIDGEELDIVDLKNFCDTNDIRKTYKISDIEFKTIPLLDSVISRIAAKDLL